MCICVLGKKILLYFYMYLILHNYIIKQIDSKLLPSWHQTRSEIGDKSVSAIIHVLLAKPAYQIENWQQKPSKLHVTLSNDELTIKTEHICDLLLSEYLMQILLNFCR